MPEPLKFIFLFFPPNLTFFSTETLNSHTLRLGGVTAFALAIFSYLLAKHGIRGIFLSGKSWRWMFFTCIFTLSLLGGFRSQLAFFLIVFALQFHFEGLHRTKLVPIFVSVGVISFVLLIILTPQLPPAFQRTLSFLPLNVKADVEKDAQESADWRFEMWKALASQIPEYLLVGKGYALSANDFQLLAGPDAAVHVASGFAENQILAVSGGYHNGPLSVILTFGLWGVITVIWFWVAGTWVLYRNYRYGDPALRTANIFLLAAFVSRIIFFLFIFGDIGSEIQFFCGWLGMGVALNGGVCQPSPTPALAANKSPAFVGIRSHLHPTLRRPTVQG